MNLLIPLLALAVGGIGGWLLRLWLEPVLEVRRVAAAAKHRREEIQIVLLDEFLDTFRGHLAWLMSEEAEKPEHQAQVEARAREVGEWVVLNDLRFPERISNKMFLLQVYARQAASPPDSLGREGVKRREVQRDIRQLWSELEEYRGELGD